MLFESLNPRRPLRRRVLSLVASIVLHTLAITAIVALPLIFHEKLPELSLLTFVAPPPVFVPPPPPAPPLMASKPKTIVAKYSVPTELPKSIPPPPQEEPPTIVPPTVGVIAGIGMAAGSTVGVPGGIPGGIVGNPLPPPPPPPVPEPAPAAKPVVKPIYVGGDIQAAKIMYKQPVAYPDLALKARIAGVVLLRITVNEEGKVTDIKVISGHPVLVPAAIEAVSHWRYSPTVLNGQPVPVIATVAVNFSLQ